MHRGTYKVFWCVLVPYGSSNNSEDVMTIVIDSEKYTVLMTLIQTAKGFVGSKVQPNGYTLKCSFDTSFACCISKNNKNSNLAVHFENESSDPETHFAILSAIS
jgi:hypothetical protein